jgi:hypothetical protein
MKAPKAKLTKYVLKQELVQKARKKIRHFHQFRLSKKKECLKDKQAHSGPHKMHPVHTSKSRKKAKRGTWVIENKEPKIYLKMPQQQKRTSLSKTDQTNTMSHPTTRQWVDELDNHQLSRPLSRPSSQLQVACACSDCVEHASNSGFGDLDWPDPNL